jgi:RNA polymerase sigma-70 factor (ECF subfamily)
MTFSWSFPSRRPSSRLFGKWCGGGADWLCDGEGGISVGDFQLVQRILSGDGAAGERLVADHYLRLYRWLYHLTGSQETAKDLVQQVFLSAWQALASFRGEASLKTWLHRIAYHEYAHWLRTRRQHASLEDVVPVIDDPTQRQWEAMVLREALAQLSAEHRETFLLYHVQGLSVLEVAVVMDVPAGTIKSRLFTARQRLRELLTSSEVAAPRAEPPVADTQRPSADGKKTCHAPKMEGEPPR